MAILIRCSLFLFVALLASCGKSGPASAATNSSQIATVGERVEFLNRYVSFRRSYETLDFDVMYQNNAGGMVAGPSDWDVRLIATVPESELQAWIPQGAQPSPQLPDRDWLKSIPTTVDLADVNEWYIDGHRVVGLDRAHRIVVYRSRSS